MKKLMCVLVASYAALLPCVYAQPQSKPAKPELKNQASQAAVKQPGKVAQDAFARIMGAVEANDYTRFVLNAEDAFKAAMTKQVFAQVSDQVAPRLKKGYRATYLGSLKKGGYQAYLWKLTFADGGDDILAQLSLNEENVGGFFLL